jgi:hypothetical protein
MNKLHLILVRVALTVAASGLYPDVRPDGILSTKILSI